jgi:hypothetical protein
MGHVGYRALVGGSKSIYSVAFWDEELFENDAYVHLWKPGHLCEIVSRTDDAFRS